MGGQFPDPDEALTERIDALVAEHGVTRRKMFGTLSWFLESNSQMFASIWGDGVVVRLGEDEASELVASGQASAFVPMGDRPMKEYVFVPEDAAAEDDTLEEWLDRSAAFAGGLPPKKKRK